MQLFEEGGLPWKTTAALGCLAAEGLIKLKRNSEAIKILEQIEKSFKKALRPKQLKGLALARRNEDGDLDNAENILGLLYAKNHLDPETMGIYARIKMDKYSKFNNDADLAESRDLYAAAFEKAPGDYYTGINAASKSVFIGTAKDLERASSYAAEVEKLVGSKETPGDYWKTATVAEVFLIQKKYTEAAAMYEKAVAMAKSELASHETTWKQACRLMRKLIPTDQERALILAAFKHLPNFADCINE